MEKFKDDAHVDGLAFGYRHFYGSYDFVGDSRKWYLSEVRIVRKRDDVTSYRDAQGFRKKDGSKLNAVRIDAEVYHYGWVKHPDAQQAKQESFHRMWHDDEWMKKNVPAVNTFDYSQIDSLASFTGSHPAVMKDRIARQNWKFSFDPTKKKWGLKMRFLMWWERSFGIRIGEYRNYNPLKR
jgi:hypothetical protein